MDNYLIFDTSCATLNVGDQIIMESFEREMSFLLTKGFYTKYPTHSPVSHFYQNTKYNRYYRYINSCKYKFVGGTNILAKNMFEPWPNWNVNILNCKPYKGCILVGCGVGKGEKNFNLYTRLLYKKMLNKNIIHSTRDEKTKCMLEAMGLKAINTGCVTTWMLNDSHCRLIPREKGQRVVFTLTDYIKDYEKDQKMIDILCDNYKEVYYWVQGSGDLEYFQSFKNIDRITIIPPNLKEYKKILQYNDIDYVGTRLHAGIYAMQNKCRSIIIVVDNRARDMNKDYNLNCIEREEIETLNKKINSEFDTRLNIHEAEISKWKSQFKTNEV